MAVYVDDCVNPSEQDFDENLQLMTFVKTTQEVTVVRTEMNKYTPCSTKKVIHRKTKTTNPVRSRSLSPIPSKPPRVTGDFANLEESQRALGNLLKVPHLRKSKSQSLETELEDETVSSLRKRLADVEQHNILSAYELKNLKGELKQEKQRSSNFEMKLSNIEIYIRQLIDEIQKLREFLDAELTPSNVED